MKISQFIEEMDFFTMFETTVKITTKSGFIVITKNYRYENNCIEITTDINQVKIPVNEIANVETVIE